MMTSEQFRIFSGVRKEGWMDSRHLFGKQALRSRDFFNVFVMVFNFTVT